MSPHLLRTCYRRELRAHLYSSTAAIFIICFLIFVGILTFITGHFFERGEAALDHAFFVWFPWLYALLIPALCMNAWAGEFRHRTLEVLLTRPVPLGYFIAGKFLAALTIVLISLVLTLPVALTTAYLGDPDSGKLLSGYLGCLLLGSAFTAIALMCSASTRSPIVAFITASALSLLLVLISMQSFGLEAQRALAPDGWLLHTFHTLGVQRHFITFTKGLIAWRSLLYFLGLTIAALAATHLCLRRESTTR